MVSGGHETLGRYRPTIMIEFFPEGLQKLNTSAEELLALLHELRYDTFRLTWSGLKPFRDISGDDHWNVVCTPNG